MTQPTTHSSTTDLAAASTPSLWRTLRWPLLLPVLLALLELVGARDDAVVLSGTAPLGLRSVLGLVYVMVWFVCIVALPPWVAGLLLGRAALALQRFLRPYVGKGAASLDERYGG